MPDRSIVRYYLASCLVVFVFSSAEAFADLDVNRILHSTDAMNDDYDDFGLEDEFVESDVNTTFDPAGGYNRVMLQVNDKLYFWILKPVAKGYGTIVPEPGRRAVSHFFRNSVFPIRLVNNILQLKFKGAGTECLRFAVNTSFGVLGFGDPATSKFNLKEYNEDFGQTFGHYGIGAGFHLVLPVLGPSNLRDLAGLVPDSFLTWHNYVHSSAARLSIAGFRTTNHTSLHIGEYENFKENAFDFYILFRDSYEQNRKMKISE